MASLNILTASNHTVTVTLHTLWLYKYLLTIMKGVQTIWLLFHHCSIIYCSYSPSFKAIFSFVNWFPLNHRHNLTVQGFNVIHIVEQFLENLPRTFSKISNSRQNSTVDFIANWYYSKYARFCFIAVALIQSRIIISGRMIFWWTSYKFKNEKNFWSWHLFDYFSISRPLKKLMVTVTFDECK